MKPNNEDQKRRQKTVRLVHQFRANLVHDNRFTVEISPKRGGHAFRKRRSFHES